MRQKVNGNRSQIGTTRTALVGNVQPNIGRNKTDETTPQSFNEMQSIDIN